MLNHGSEAHRQMTDQPLPPKTLAHVVFRTARFAEMVGFWTQLLNAQPVFENEQVAFLRFDEEHHRIAIVNMPFLTDIPKHLSPGFEHAAFTYETLGDLLSTYRRLRRAGIKPIWCINHGPTTSIYYADPDGNKMELQFDNLDNSAADNFMRGSYFAKNPIGVDFDPERMIERYLRGDPIDELLRQGSALPPLGAGARQPEVMIPYDRRGELLDPRPENTQ